MIRKDKTKVILTEIFRRVVFIAVIFVLLFSIVIFTVPEIRRHIDVEHKPFSKELWFKLENGHYNERKNIIVDLQRNILRKGMTYRQVWELIGDPPRYADSLKYLVEERYLLNANLDERVFLIVKFDSDSLLYYWDTYTQKIE